ncbi:MAG: mannose-1-phosphate guanylyltransferase [Gemmatimonadota bacterium]
MVTPSAAKRTFAVVLAGGIGSRFWPASTPDRPKQLLPLAGDDPLIVETVRRAECLVKPENVRLLTGRELVVPFQSVLPDYTDERFWIEPEPRGTGPALTWAAARIESEAPGAMMISLHADHLIGPLPAFAETIDRALGAAATRGSLVCLGVTPTRAEAGYGYIELGDAVDEGLHAVTRFVEKPEAHTARAYSESGRHLWNSGIFVWRASDFLAAAERWCEEIAPGLPALASNDADAFFENVSDVSVDVGVLERATNVETVVATFDWDDVGTWEAVARTSRGDAAGNVMSGRTAVIEGSANIVWSDTGRVVLFGVDDLVVVRSGDETLVMRRDLAPDLKRALEQLEEAGE